MKSKSGKGTTFTVKLARAEAVKSHAVAKTGEGSSSYRLLLVERCTRKILNLLRDMERGMIRCRAFVCFHRFILGLPLPPDFNNKDFQLYIKFVDKSTEKPASR